MPGIIQDIWVSLIIWSAQRSGGRPLRRRHDEGGVGVEGPSGGDGPVGQSFLAQLTLPQRGCV